jgi:threonine dehydratase
MTELSEDDAGLGEATGLPRTRLVEARSLGTRTAARVYLKLESEMPTGSFKVRGALHALATNLRQRPIPEVVAASTGNHGAAVAWAARRLGVRARIFLPRDPNPVKRANVAGLGAAIVEEGRDLADAGDAAAAYASRTGAYFLNDATDPDLPGGPAAIADEIVADLPDVDAIYVPVGDTALIRAVAGRAKELKRTIRIVGVQSERAPAYVLSWRQGAAVPTATADTIADGLATRTPIADNVRAIRSLVDDMRLVSDDAIVDAIGTLLVAEHIVAEPAGAAALAALLDEPAPASPRRIVLLITGCNVTPAILRQAIARVTDVV